VLDRGRLQVKGGGVLQYLYGGGGRGRAPEKGKAPLSRIGDVFFFGWRPIVPLKTAGRKKPFARNRGEGGPSSTEGEIIALSKKKRLENEE